MAGVCGKYVGSAGRFQAPKRLTRPTMTNVPGMTGRGNRGVRRCPNLARKLVALGDQTAIRSRDLEDAPRGIHPELTLGHAGAAQREMLCCQ